MDFARMIKRLRTDANMTQEDVANRLGLSKNAVGAWENGRAKPRLGKLHQLAGLFGVPVSELLGEREAVGTSAFVPMRAMGCAHMGEFSDEPDPDRVVEVPKGVLDKVADPDAYVVRMRGACMNRRYPEDCDALISPNTEPSDGAAVIAEYEGETICRVFRRGASTVMLSPDSFDPSYKDIVFSDPDGEPLVFQGVVRWFQASKVEGGAD